jgi:Spy/CpxP family protein refolding chaperone
MERKDMKKKSDFKPITILAVAWGALLLSAGNAFSQSQPAHKHPPTNAPASVEAQLNQLRQQVAELSRIVQSHGSPAPQNAKAMPGMGAAAPMSGGSGMGAQGMGMDGMMQMMSAMHGGGGMQQKPGHPMGMGMMDMDMMKMKGMGGNMPGMNPPPSGGMGMMEMMGMMHGMGGMQNMAVPSALPGFPGASHLYHIGATGFFLDHPEHITLTTEQQTKLNKIKEDAVLAKSTADRTIAQAEQELWELTGSDQPDIAKIEGKVRENEKLRSDARLSFIRSVGEAAKVLTDEQRKSLVGQAPHGAKPPDPQHKH